MKTTIAIITMAIAIASSAFAQHRQPTAPFATAPFATFPAQPPLPPMPPGISRHQPDTTIIVPVPSDTTQLTEGIIINNNTGSRTSYHSIGNTTIINTY